MVRRSIPGVTTTGYRITYTLLGLALAAIIAGAVFLIPSGDPTTLPDAVDSFSPADGDIVVRPVKVVLDLAPNYRAQFIIDGVVIPDDQVDSIRFLGQYPD